ncbi:MAG TPA: squalene/phytoene synthase family protein [Alphaproteobacteria bacterium]|nr:squalene/phytoene synthase family protein [Alphaproteobacteria bacterium]
MSSSQASPLAEIAQAALRDLPEPARAALAALARLAIAARAVAADAALPIDKRIAMLDGLEALLDGRKPEVPLPLPLSAAARDVAEALRAAGTDMTAARHLLQAWKQDCAKPAYRDWADWMLFARFAAAPFGRQAAEDAAVPAAEALACALLLCLCLQDAAEDWRARGKVCLPERWLRERGAKAEDLAEKPADASAWRAVYREDAGRALAQLLAAAAPLSRSSHGIQLALGLTRRWAARLAAGDPWRGPVRLTGWDRLRARLAAWL